MVKETIRDMWTFRWIEVLRQDLRYAARTLRKSPGFTIVAALTLALGIGANTAIFSVVDAVILRPLPYPEPSRLVELWGNVKRAKVERRGASFPDYLDWRAQSRSFEAMAAFDSGTMTLTGVDEPERITGEFVSQPYFDLLGMRPALGRTFLPEEDEVPQRNAVIILSDGLWKRRFGADPAIVGRTVQLDGRTWSIVGVMPAWFRGITDQAEAWVPFQDDRHRRRTSPNAATAASLSSPASSPESRTPRRRPNSMASPNVSKRRIPETNEGRAVEVATLDHELFGDIQQAPAGPALRRGLRAADRLHQCRQPSAGAFRSAAARNRHAHRPGRRPRPRAVATRRRKLRAGAASAPAPDCCWPTGASRL